MPIILLDWQGRAPCLGESDQVWESLADDANIPEGTDGLLIPFERFICAPETCLACGRPLAIELSGTDDPIRLQPWLAELAQIHIGFATFNDGRGFSSAQLLRRRLRFSGRLIAVGDVLRDQLCFMIRCGFDGFALPAPFDPAILDEIPYIYQPDALDRQTVLQARHAPLSAQEARR